MTTRCLLSVALATFTAVQGLHTECWFVCDDAGRPAAGLGCHQDSAAGPTLSDNHHCANHAPLSALTVGRTGTVMHVAMAAFQPRAALNDDGEPLGQRTRGFIRSPGPPDFPTPLRN